MTYVLAFLAGLAGAVAGYALAALAGIPLTEWFDVSAVEGNRGLLIAFVIGPLGGIVGMLVAIVVTLTQRLPGAGVAALAGRSVIVVLALAATVPAGLWIYEVVVPSPYLAPNAAEPILHFEIRLGAGAFVPADRSLVRVTLDTDRNQAEAEFDADWRRDDGGRPVIRGRLSLFFRTRQRFVVLRVPLEPDRVFDIGLPADPPTSPQYGPWRRAVRSAGADEAARPAAAADEPAEIRVRVSRID